MRSGSSAASITLQLFLFSAFLFLKQAVVSSYACKQSYKISVRTAETSKSSEYVEQQL